MRSLTPRRIIGLLVATLFAVIALSSCGDPTPTAQDKERAGRQDAYTRSTDKQPANYMEFSPTRRTINAWAKTWDDPNALAYTYIKDQDGSVGYYVFLGPPVSYNVSITPTYDKAKIDCGQYCSEAIVPAPGIDNAFYSGGGDSVYYGIDAVTGGVASFSVGQGQNMQYFSTPNSRYKSPEPLGDATIEKAKQKKGQ